MGKSSFTSEIEKSRLEAVERLKENAKKMGANAVIRTDIETSGLYMTISLFSATGTAVIIEKQR